MVQKWPLRDRQLFLVFWLAEAPIFIVSWGCARFGPSYQESFWTKQRHRKFWLIIDKLSFWYFLFFLFFFKGQVRWLKGPPHLALNPPCLFCFFLGVCFFFFPFLFLEQKKPCFSPKNGHFCLFVSISLCFSLVFSLPPFHSLFLCLSLVLFFFLHSFLFFFCSLLFPCFSLFVCLPSFFAFVSCKEQHQNIKSESLFHQSFVFFAFLCCFLFQHIFSYLCFSSWFDDVFFVQHQCFGFEKDKLKHNTIWSRGALQQNIFINCAMQNVKKYFFGAHLWARFQILVDVQKAL